MASIREKLMWRAAKQRAPITGAFELTPMCNFQCKMCYVRKTPQEVAAMGGLKPLSFWLRVAEQARDAGTLSPLLTGGETFLYPHIRELYTAMYKMGMELTINSNGSCITPEIVSWLREMPPVRINITLYGGSNQSYGRLCGDPHGLDKVRRGVELLQENGIRFKFNCSLMPENAADLEQMLDFSRQHGVDGLRVATYMFPPSRRVGLNTPFSQRLTPDQSAYYQVLSNWLQLPPEEFRKNARAAMRFQKLTPELIAQAEAGEPQPMSCLSGRCSFWVDWQGNFSGCGMTDYPKIDLEEHSFTEAWEQIVDWTNQMRYCAVCANCVNHRVCQICPAMVYNETGGFDDRPVYLCEKTEACAKYYQEFLDRMPEDDSESRGNDSLPQPSGCVFDEM